jgi:hypothetical protein
MTGVTEHFGKSIAQHRVRHEQTTEEQNFCRQEQPHAKLGAVKLVVRRVKVVLKKRVLGVLSASMGDIMSVIMNSVAVIGVARLCLKCGHSFVFQVRCKLVQILGRELGVFC